MRVGQTDVDFEALTIDSPSGHFTMESKVMRLLKVLVDNPGTVMTRSDLIEQVWGVEYGGDERLSRGISLIRKAFGDSRGKHDYIETIPRRGYRFIAPIETDIAPPDPISPIENPESHPTFKANETIDVAAPAHRAVTTDMPIAAKRASLGFKPLILGSLVAIALATTSFTLLKTPVAERYEVAKVERGLDYIKHFTRPNAIDDAKTLFSDILSEDPDSAAASAGLSLALMREYTHLESDPSILRRARSSAEAALRSDNHLGLANVALGWAKEMEGDLEGARKSYDRAEILDPDNVFMLEGLARTYNKQGRGEDAKKTLERGISLYPDTPIFYSFSGQQLLGQNEYKHAETMFRHLITLSPENSRAYAQLAQSLHLQDRTSEAVKILQQGLQVNPSALLYNNLGTYLFFQGQYEMSVEAFEKTLELDGNSHKYLYWANLADAYRFVPTRRTDAYAAYDRAIELLQIELDKSPANRQLNSRAAMYKAKRGDLEAARSHLARVPLDLDLSSSDYYRAVVTYEILSERKEALVMLKKALRSGYPLTEIKNDPELKNLRQDKKYHLLISQEGKNL